MPIGVLVEGWPSSNAWQSWSWRALAAIPAIEGSVHQKRVLRRDNAGAVFHAGHRILELHHRETAFYLQNLSLDEPVIYVVLRPTEEALPDLAVEPFHVTVSPEEAQGYTEGDDILDTVPMPDFVFDWVGRFLDAFHDEGASAIQRRRKRKVMSASPQNDSPTVSHPVWRIPERHG